MPRFDGDGGRVVTTLFEAAAYHYAIRVTCRCKRSEVLNPHALWWHFRRHGWDERLFALREHLVCSGCGKRRATVVITTKTVTIDALPLPPLHEWRRAVNRFRN